ncbi:hypothetical protein [Streptomyces sp. NPDC002889]|uniref:hypothetical protein n=1 Tax=Streptomyces sp. NPDC002889 TaxID=3364669 RepID=UPI00369CBCA4
MSTKGTSTSIARFDAAAGERLKNDGMAEADDSSDPAWADQCDAAIEEMARRRIPFQASDLVKQGLVGEPDKHQQWGPRFSTAAKHGLIRELTASKSKRTSSRSSRLVTWIGA